MKFKVQIKITMRIRLEILQSIDRSIGVFSQRGVGTAPRALGFSWTTMVETRPVRRRRRGRKRTLTDDDGDDDAREDAGGADSGGDASTRGTPGERNAKRGA